MTSETDNEEVVKIYGPRPSGEWLLARKRQQEIEEEQANRDDSLSWIADMKARADREIARWDALACKQQLELVTNCTDAIKAECPEASHVMCPRRRLKRLAVEERTARSIKRRELEESGMETLILEAIFDSSPGETDAMRKLREAFASSPRPAIVVLQGGVGCGKSCAAAVWLLENGARWITAKRLARLGPYSKEFESYTRGPVVIDDLGAEYADQKGFFVTMVDEIVDGHHNSRTPLVLTTNLTAEDFKARYKERVADRIRETGRFVRVDGKSMRTRR